MDRRFRLKTILTAILLLIFVSSAIADKKTDAVDKLFSQWEKKDTPGCALAIVKDGKIIYKQGYLYRFCFKTIRDHVHRYSG
jgi:CubicO group peptidase (beta-lactamase class C family)